MQLLDQGIIPTSLQVLAENIFTSLYMQYDREVHSRYMRLRRYTYRGVKRQGCTYIEVVVRPTVLHIIYCTASVQQTNLLPENASWSYAILPNSLCHIISEHLVTLYSSYGVQSPYYMCMYEMLSDFLDLPCWLVHLGENQYQDILVTWGAISHRLPLVAPRKWYNYMHLP